MLCKSLNYQTESLGWQRKKGHFGNLPGLVIKEKTKTEQEAALSLSFAIENRTLQKILWCHILSGLATVSQITTQGHILISPIDNCARKYDCAKQKNKQKQGPQYEILASI